MRMCLRTAGGFTLIEVLVAVLVLAIGVISAAGAQLSALRTRHGSALMSEGVQLASSLADRMRANPAQMRLGADANPYLQWRYDAASGAPTAPPLLCYVAGNCSSEQMAHFDLYDIALALHFGFPGGRVAVCRDAALWDAQRRALSWDCAGGAAAPVVIKLGWRARRADGRPATEGDAPAVAIVVSEVGR